MSYIVIKLYSFECDGAPPDRLGAEEIAEFNPVESAPPGRSLLAEAHRSLREIGWAVRKTGNGWEHYCPEHKSAPRVREAISSALAAEEGESTDG